MFTNNWFNKLHIKAFVCLYKILKKLVFFLINFSGLPFFVREIIARNKITIILYHDINKYLFEQHFKALIKRYKIISLQHYLKARHDSHLKIPKKALIITFDDAHKSNYSLLSTIKENNIPVTIFLCSSLTNTNRHFWFKESVDNIKFDSLRTRPDEYRVDYLKNHGFEEEKEYDTRQALNKEEIIEMSNYVDFQSHTKFHPFLPNCSFQRADDEIRGSKKELENKFGFKINSISYPNGDYKDREIKLTHDAGYELGITVDIGFNTIETNPYKLKRICINDNANVNELLVQASGIWQILKIIFRKD
jgi:peptidoglycan/xylan/chitin deacetylase (PgdA/CDA1 family)